MVSSSSKRFPLPVSPFAPLELSQPDEEAIATIANDLLVAALVDYEMLQIRDAGVMNPARWKAVKHFENLTAYQARETRRKLSTADSWSSNRHPKLVWRGFLDGKLDDVMFGLISQTDESARVKASYVRNNVVDQRVLATIATPTASDPFQGLQVKWTVVDSGPGAVKQFVKRRDFVYLEATGVTRNSIGERVGFHIIHSLSIPEAHELPDHNLVRGSISYCHLFREKWPGCVELYSKTSLDLHGNMPATVEMLAACKMMASVERLVECAELKKVSRIYELVSKSLPVSKKSPRDRSCCQLCQKELHGERSLRGRTKHCRICLSSVCSKCSVSKKLSFVSTLTGQINQQKMIFCTECVSRVTRTSAERIQLDEIDQDVWGGHFIDTQCSSWSLSSPESLRDSFRAAREVWSDSFIEMRQKPSLSSSRSSWDSFRGVFTSNQRERC